MQSLKKPNHPDVCAMVINFEARLLLKALAVPCQYGLIRMCFSDSVVRIPFLSPFRA